MQLERQADIIANIKKSKKEILEKQTFGRKLALNISDPKTDLEAHLSGEKLQPQNFDRFEREQRYH